MNTIALPWVAPRERPEWHEYAKDLLAGIMHAVTHPTTVRNAMADLVVDLIDVSTPGVLIFQTSGAVEVATCTFAATAFGDAASGIATAATIVPDSSATGGTTDRFIINDGAASLVLSGSVSTSGADINLSSVAIGATDTVDITSLTYAAAA